MPSQRVVRIADPIFVGDAIVDGDLHAAGNFDCEGNVDLCQSGPTATLGLWGQAGTARQDRAAAGVDATNLLAALDTAGFIHKT